MPPKVVWYFVSDFRPSWIVVSVHLYRHFMFCKGAGGEKPCSVFSGSNVILNRFPLIMNFILGRAQHWAWCFKALEVDIVVWKLRCFSWFSTCLILVLSLFQDTKSDGKRGWFVPFPADSCSRWGSLNGSNSGCDGALIFQGSIFR